MDILTEIKQVWELLGAMSVPGTQTKLHASAMIKLENVERQAKGLEKELREITAERDALEKELDAHEA